VSLLGDANTHATSIPSLGWRSLALHLKALCEYALRHLPRPSSLPPKLAAAFAILFLAKQRCECIVDDGEGPIPERGKDNDGNRPVDVHPSKSIKVLPLTCLFLDVEGTSTFQHYGCSRSQHCSKGPSFRLLPQNFHFEIIGSQVSF